MIIYTVGHSTRSIAEFLEILRSFEIEALGDVRTYPGSKRHPHFNKVNLSRFMTRNGISYTHLRGLGGFREPKLDSPNKFFKKEAFNGYADHMASADFEKELQNLFELSSYNRTTLMCAEARATSCHRSLISDMLVSRNVEVVHILGAGESVPHKLSEHAVVADGVITYPGKAESKQMDLF
jgi:uncharacterized protein (DUF488 family)